MMVFFSIFLSGGGLSTTAPFGYPQILPILIKARFSMNKENLIEIFFKQN